MTLKVIEGFDYIPTGTADVYAQLQAGQWYPRGYVLGGAIVQRIGNDSTGVGTAFGYGNVYYVDQTVSLVTATQRWSTPVGEGLTEGWVGARVYVEPGHDGFGYLHFFDALNNAVQVSVSWEQNGILRVYLNEGAEIPNPGVLIATSEFGAYYAGKWFYLEVYCKIGDTDGRVTVRVNTVTVIDAVTENTNFTGSGTFDGVGFGMPRVNASFTSWHEAWRLDDFYFCDSAGSLNNGFLGNVRVMAQIPVSDGSTNNFAIGGSSPAATNWQSVLGPQLGEVKFIYDNNAGDHDLYEIDPIVNSPLVHGVQVRAAARMDDATQRAISVMIRSAGVEEESDPFYINQTYSYYRHIFELNPATGVGWTGTEVNLIEVGPKVIS